MRRTVAVATLGMWFLVLSAGMAWAHGEPRTGGDFEIGQLVVALVPLAAGALGMVASNTIDGLRMRDRARRRRQPG